MSVVIGNSYSGYAVAASYTWAHNVQSGDNRILLVSVTIRDLAHVSSISYGAQSFTKKAEISNGTGNVPRAELWYLLNPIIGNNLITVTLPGGDLFSVGSLDLFGVDQNTPFGNIQTVTGNTTTASATITGANEIDLGINVIAAGVGSVTLAVGTGQTQLWVQQSNVSWIGGGGYSRGIGNLTPTWTTNQPWAMIALIVNAAKWITPVFDRDNTDIINKTSKGYFNTWDWGRIYSNTIFANSLVANLKSVSIHLDTIAIPTYTSFPNALDINKMAGNIDLIRSVMALPSSYELIPIRKNWGEGKTVAPAYFDINVWEKTLAVIVGIFQQRKPRTGRAITGSGMTRNNMFRGI